MAATGWTRRKVLQQGLGLVAAATFTSGLQGCGSSSGSGPVFTGGGSLEPVLPPADFPQPTVRSSVNGFLDTSFTVAESQNIVDGFTLNTPVYEGSIPGPTLRLNQGDLLRLRQVNDLPPNQPQPAGTTHNYPHARNTFNLHTHGLHVDPNGLSDNIFARFEPGTTNTSVVQLPADHPEGTFWYHPHVHGSSTEQIAGGMAGLIIVNGPTDQVPEIAAARDIALVIQDIRVDNDGRVPDFTNSAAVSNAPNRFILINGQQRPTLHMRPGEVQRWRLAMASFRSLFDISLDGHTLHQIAMDGLTYSQTVERQSIFLVAGNRADVMVQAGAPGTYILRTTTTGNPAGDTAAELMTVVVEGDPVNMQLPTTLPGTPSLPPITDAEVAVSTAGPNGNGKRCINFLVSPNAAGFLGSAAAAQSFTTAFRITGTGETPALGPTPPGYDPEAWCSPNPPLPGQTPPITDTRWGLFDPNFVNQTLVRNTVEEWTIIGTGHPFHIHINPFLVVAVDGVPLNPPEWRDTVSPSGRVITIRMRPMGFSGKAVLHCHILDHEDTGMMQQIEVICTWLALSRFSCKDQGSADVCRSACHGSGNPLRC